MRMLRGNDAKEAPQQTAGPEKETRFEAALQNYE
jgi:hypothetical protein